MHVSHVRQWKERGGAIASQQWQKRQFCCFDDDDEGNILDLIEVSVTISKYKLPSALHKIIVPVMIWIERAK